MVLVWSAAFSLLGYKGIFYILLHIVSCIIIIWLNKGTTTASKYIMYDGFGQLLRPEHSCTVVDYGDSV